MFTWNLQYISKNRLAEAFDQLMLNPRNGDILIRIHTAIHLENEAVLPEKDDFKENLLAAIAKMSPKSKKGMSLFSFLYERNEDHWQLRHPP